MSDTWRLVIVVLAATVVIEGVFLVAVMRQLGELDGTYAAWPGRRCRG